MLSSWISVFTSDKSTDKLRMVRLLDPTSGSLGGPERHGILGPLHVNISTPSVTGSPGVYYTGGLSTETHQGKVWLIPTGDTWLSYDTFTTSPLTSEYFLDQPKDWEFLRNFILYEQQSPLVQNPIKRHDVTYWLCFWIRGTRSTVRGVTPTYQVIASL